MPIIMKFGGSSLADAERVINAAKKVADARSTGRPVAVVVSAQGDTTDQLLHQAAQINPCPGARELDAYLSAGEQMSAALMAMALEAMDCPAVSLTGPQIGLLTDGKFGSARILGLTRDRIQQEWDRGRVAVVTGFQGVDARGNITTLGRGGSDTTAVALAAFLKARECNIYTDVDGVYDRDPRKHPDAVKLDVIGYPQMLEMARKGAQVLQDVSVEMGMRFGVPIRVLSSFRRGEGTLVTELLQ